MGKILGLDIGINNVGYGIIDSDSGEIIKSGVRLFEEAKRNANEDRRGFRCIRRQIRRRHHRLERIKKCFSKYGLPVDAVSTNPYELRRKTIYERAELWEVSAALLHIAKRRGSVLDVPEEPSADTNGFSTKEQIMENDKALNNKYVCEVQLEWLRDRNKIRGHENVFRLADYVKEAEAILNNQRQYHNEISDDFIKEYLDIMQSRRMYYDGPGSEKSPTPYGQFFYDEQGKLQHIGMIEKMRGKCTFFPNEPRIAKMTYTADLFNLLNDLNNIRFNGNKLSFEDKQYLVSEYVDKGKNITPNIITKYIKSKYKDDMDDEIDEHTISGFRMDLKNQKPMITEFKGFKILKKYIDSEALPTFLYEDKAIADEIIEILTSYKDIKNREEKLRALLSKSLNDEDMKNTIEVLSEDTKFKEYHSLSRAAIECILDDLWHTNDNQMQLFTEKGFFETKSKANKGKNIVFDDTAILSTVAKRAHREAIKIINKVRELYGELDGISIEMAREKNSEDLKDMYKNMQKQQGELESYVKEQFRESDLSRLALTSKQWLAIKLLRQQDGKCIYSHNPINIYDIKENFRRFEIDHIIPLSLSFDDSLNNKVLCYREENQAKGQRTPFEYYSSGKAKISYTEFKTEVLRLYKGNKSKLNNLLEERDIKFNDELQKQFINRNLVDTRYAARSLMSTLKDYFKANNIDTKVYSIRGSFTNSFRKASGIKKDRDESYAHHAIDALIVASMAKRIPSFSQIRKYASNDNGDIFDKETGEIFADKTYFDNITLRYIHELSSYDNICYSHKVDRKVNRAIIGKQTIYGTRTKDNDEYIINKYSDIYSLDKKSCTELIKKLKDTPDKFLIYVNNREVYELIMRIIDEYKDANNPFLAYKNEYGYILKNGKVPVKTLRYYDRKLGTYKDISNKYINPKNKVVMLQMQYIRVDIYKCEKGYRFVALPYMEFLPKGNKYVISKESYERLKAESKIDDKAEFCFSLYKFDEFMYKIAVKNELVENEAIFIAVSNRLTNKIEIDFVDKKKNEQKEGIRTLGTFKDIVKINTDVLGNKYYIKKEKGPKLSLQE